MSRLMTNTALPAADLADSLGVNVHLEWTDGDYRNVDDVISDLAYLGIDSVRDATLATGNQGQASYGMLAEAGIDLVLMVPGWQSLSDALTLLHDFAIEYPDAIHAIEGPNEPSVYPFTYKGLSGYDAAI